MQLAALLLTICSLTVTARSISQSITFSGNDVELEKIFEIVEQQTGHFIFYQKELLADSKPVTINASGMPLTEFMSKIMERQPLSYSIKNTSIIIKSKNLAADLSPRLPFPSLSSPPITVRGRILDEKKEWLAGATVRVKGTDISTTSDGEGAFILNNVPQQAILEISYVGYQTVNVKATAEVTVSLQFNDASLGEVIVNKGYYSETQKLSTGSVSKINSKDIQQQPVSNVLGAMIGRMPGVQVTQQSGLPGSGFDIKIRGLNSLRNTSTNNGNRPLYIIDGVPFNSKSIAPPFALNDAGLSPFAAIAPADIESIEILKDADATAIYGSRGANGIVLITTKKGKSGKTTANVDVSQGFASVPKYIDLLNTQQYLEMREEAYANDNQTPDGNGARDLLLYNRNDYTDFQRELFGNTASVTNARASLSGGNANSNFTVGLGYARETTVFTDQSNDQKFNMHFQINNTSDNKKLRTSFGGLFVTNLIDLTAWEMRYLNGGFDLPPNAPKMFTEDGQYNFAFGFINPKAIMNKRTLINTQNLNLNSTIEYDIFNNFTLKTSVGYNTIGSEHIRTTPIKSANPAVSPKGSAFFDDGKSTTWIVEPQLQYKKAIEKAAINVLVGGTIQNNASKIQTLRGSAYTNDAFIENLLSAPVIERLPENATSDIKFKYVKAHARVNINYDERYILNLTASRDGSSRFGPNKRFSNFGAAGLAWVFSETSLIKNNNGWLSFGKLRGSYGIAGSDNIPDYGFLDTYSSTSVPPYDGVAGLVPARLYNPDYVWEKNRKFEVALELGFLNDRINLMANWYRNRSSNQLVGYPLSTVTGFPSLQYYNLPATVQNTGVEIVLSANLLKKQNLSWNSSFNFTVPKNKLVEYPDLEHSGYKNTYVINQPLDVRTVFKYTGVDPETGIYQFEDVDNNGVLDQSDKTVYINAGQRFYGGWQNNFSLGQFEISIFFQFVKQLGIAPFATFSTPGLLGNKPVEVLDRWRKPGDQAKFQKFSNDYSVIIAYQNMQQSDFYFTDASFVRLKNINVSYKLPSPLLKRLGIQRVNVFVQGQNLLTFTEYNGFDPENMSLETIPPLRVIMAGVQLSF